MKGALEPKQRKLLAAIVALHRRVPADQSARFRAHHSHQGSFLSHPAAIDWGPVVAVSDLDVLRLTGAISVTGTDDRGANHELRTAT